jgi:hypothetical protein
VLLLCQVESLGIVRRALAHVRVHWDALPFPSELPPA